MTMAEREMEAVKRGSFSSMSISTNGLALPGSPAAAETAGAMEGKVGQEQEPRARKAKDNGDAFAHELKAFYREKQRLEESKAEAKLDTDNSKEQSPRTPPRHGKAAGGKSHLRGGARKRTLEGTEETAVQSSPEKKAKGG